MIDVRLFKHISVLDKDVWLFKLTRLAFVPQPGEALLIGPDDEGEYFTDLITLQDNWMYMRTGDPVVNLMLDEFIQTRSDIPPDASDEVIDEIFDDALESFLGAGFSACDCPVFDGKEFAEKFPPPQEF